MSQPTGFRHHHERELELMDTAQRLTLEIQQTIDELAALIAEAEGAGHGE